MALKNSRRQTLLSGAPADMLLSMLMLVAALTPKETSSSSVLRKAEMDMTRLNGLPTSRGVTAMWLSWVTHGLLLRNGKCGLWIQAPKLW